MVFKKLNVFLVINPPTPASLSIPQPTLLEEPPIPVGFQIDLQPQQQQQQYPSISLVLPTNESSTKSATTENQKFVSDLKNTEDPTSSLSQQEELSVKGIFF